MACLWVMKCCSLLLFSALHHRLETMLRILKSLTLSIFSLGILILNSLINSDISVDSCGYTLSKIFPIDCLHKNFEARFQTFVSKRTYKLRNQTWGDYSTNVIDYDFLPHARLRINKITM